MMIRNVGILIFLVCVLNACRLPTQENLLEEIDEAVWAVPLINDELKLQNVLTVAKNVAGDVNINTDDEGKVSISYEGEVLRDPASVVFPPIFGLFDLPFSDSTFQLDLAQGGIDSEIDSAVFLRDELYFKYNYSGSEPLTITLTVEELIKDGEPMKQVIVHPGSTDGSVVQIEGPPVKIAGYHMAKNQNIITFKYDARRPNGERIEIDAVTVNWNILEFDYAQGYFPKSEREVVGSFIPIGLYSRWLSGTMNFVEPRIEVNVENSFGFAVGAEFKEMTLETIDGEVLELSSSVIDDGLLFEYPGFDEMGEVKYTDFQFTQDNSNFKEIFNNKVKQFNYRINAVANPADDPDFIAYVRSDNYYAVQLRVEVPMHLGIDDLQLVDTFDFAYEFPDQGLDSLELKLILENKFPVDLTTQVYLLDENNVVLDSIFHEGEISLKGGTYSGSNVLTNISKEVVYIDLSQSRRENLKKSKRILVKPTFKSTPNGQDPIWIYDTYGLGIKMGAKFSLD